MSGVDILRIIENESDMEVAWIGLGRLSHAGQDQRHATRARKLGKSMLSACFFQVKPKMFFQQGRKCGYIAGAEIDMVQLHPESPVS
ncbi:hypothetical protein AA15237_2184 [Komagataeibacter xylinus NBRC 15237]|nr:hypothetical protein AA15237_2184 [Komagataeibacter xylinus NBRC 15237]